MASSPPPSPFPLTLQRSPPPQASTCPELPCHLHPCPAPLGAARPLSPLAPPPTTDAAAARHAYTAPSLLFPTTPSTSRTLAAPPPLPPSSSHEPIPNAARDTSPDSFLDSLSHVASLILSASPLLCTRLDGSSLPSLSPTPSPLHFSAARPTFPHPTCPSRTSREQTSLVTITATEPSKLLSRRVVEEGHSDSGAGRRRHPTRVHPPAARLPRNCFGYRKSCRLPARVPGP